MNKFLIMPILFLSGCTPIFFNDPDLANPPKDPAKYQADLKACIDSLAITAPEALTLFATGGMGAIPVGAAVSAAEVAEGKSNDMFKSTYTRRDECIQRKGYILKP